ncbi:MAG: VOC family protein [Deltaproteobacteria bacterium]|nr:VOC family protein [Deltaproteobacteria bacterium]MBW2360831.1 VOC family protein [Deltaproteobacteria bacterium]
MSATQTPLSFTKLVVDDLERMAKFYIDVFGFAQLERIQSAIGPDPIEEILLGIDGSYDGGLILLRYVDKAPPAAGESILGFRTEDIADLVDRVCAAGGAVHAAIKHDAGAPYQVGFVTDPEGHLLEFVQMVDS